MSEIDDIQNALSCISYKIYNPHLKEFAKGGFHEYSLDFSSHWSKRGKTWNSVGALKNHLRHILEFYIGWYSRSDNEKQSRKRLGWIYKDCKAVALNGPDIQPIEIKEILKSMKDKREGISVFDKMRSIYGEDFL